MADKALKLSRGTSNIRDVAFPPGTLLPFAGTSAPDGFLLCDGSAISRFAFPELFDNIGTTWGVGDGSTTFNLPDLRGRIPVGKDNMGGVAANRMTAAGSGIDGAALGAAGGAETHTLSTAQSPSHSHGWGVHNNPGGNVRRAFANSGGTHGSNTTTNGSPTTIQTDNAGSGNSHQNTQPSAVVNYIVKI